MGGRLVLSALLLRWSPRSEVARLVALQYTGQQMLDNVRGMTAPLLDLAARTLTPATGCGRVPENNCPFCCFRFRFRERSLSRACLGKSTLSFRRRVFAKEVQTEGAACFVRRLVFLFPTFCTQVRTNQRRNQIKSDAFGVCHDKLWTRVI